MSTTQDIYNYRRVNDQLITGGQPSEDQLKAAAAEGFATIINLATLTSPSALPDEAGLVRSLGMAYYHIPVEWEHPTIGDFAAFEQVMREVGPSRTLLHCAANFRVTAFYALYALKNLGWSEAQADEFRASIWRGSDYPVWEAFVERIKAQPPMSPTSEFDLRPYAPADARTVVAVVNADAERTIGVRRAVVDGVGHVRLSRYVPPSSERVVAVTADGQVVGYAYLADKDYSIVFEVGGAVHPDYWGRGIGQRLLDWAEQRAAAQSHRAPPGVRTVLQANLYPAETQALRLFARRGYTKAREWLHLVIDLDAPPPVPDLPSGWRIRAMDLDNDWDEVGAAMDEAFADHWGVIPVAALADASSLQQGEDVAQEEAAGETPEDDTYSNSPGFCFILLDGDIVAGGILCNAQLVERADTGRVGSLFVRPQYRRQGVGARLMATALATFWRHGLRRVIADTDAASLVEAPKFYTALGMREYRREGLYEKEIRAGRDIRYFG